MITNTSISPLYFWDEMSINEANAIIDSISDKDKNSWEKTRWLGYISALTQGAKLNNPQELIKFNWECTDQEQSIVVDDTRSIEEVKQRLERILNNIN